MTTWADLWADATNELGNSDDTRRIIEEASGQSGAAWLITSDQTASQTGQQRVAEMIQRRIAGEPLQYVVGRWGFRHLDLHVDPHVLIPRPETEQVVEAAIAALGQRTSPTLVDLGTGSGAIALSLALEVAHAEVWATDVSPDALAVAEKNRLLLHEEAQQRVHFAQGTWFDALPGKLRGRVDMIVSNPPYVAETERGHLQPNVLEWEPHHALFAGDDGLDDLRVIVSGTREWLAPDGVLVVELAPTQAEVVQQLATAQGFDASIGIDFTQRQRWVLATSPEQA